MIIMKMMYFSIFVIITTIKKREKQRRRILWKETNILCRHPNEKKVMHYLIKVIYDTKGIFILDDRFTQNEMSLLSPPLLNILVKLVFEDSFLGSRKCLSFTRDKTSDMKKCVPRNT